MKYILIAAFIFIFTQNIYADEPVSNSSELIEDSESTQSEDIIVSRIDEDSEPGLSSEQSFKSTDIEFSEVEYYDLSDGPNYKPKRRILVGGIVPFIPIRSTIDASDEDPGIVQKSVSFLLYFTQNF